MKIKICITALFALLLSLQSYAHALWIETNPVGKLGSSHEVKIFFGEFADNDISPAATWFSDLKDFTLTLIAPDKTEIKLSSVAGTDHFTSSFLPKQKGVYTLVMHHTVKDTYGNMKLNYNSSANVRIGNETAGNEAFLNQNVVSLFSPDAFALKLKDSVRLTAIYSGKPAAEKEMKVFAPNGWAKGLYSNEKGEISFKPLWNGKYMAEFAYTDKTPGEQNGKKYEEVWNVATYIIFIE